MSIKKKIQNMYSLKEKVKQGGGEARIEKQLAKGKLTARLRIDTLVDPDSFVENQSLIMGRCNDFGLDENKIPGDGVVTGSAKIDGKQVFISSEDFTVLGGSLGEMHAEKISAVQKMALANGSPFIQMNDSGGARIQEGILSLDGYGKIFRNNVKSSGVIPQFSVILGPCAGGAVYSPAITDFVFMVDGISEMYITGPSVIKAVTGEDITQEELGGSVAHCEKSGVAHFRFATEQECFSFIQKLLSYLPSNNLEMPPVSESDDPVNRETPGIVDIFSADPKRPYDIKDVIGNIFDKDSFLEVQKDFARNMVIGFAKLNGRTVGLFANQPKVYAATLDIDASDKAARFIRFCDSFNIPVFSLVDVPGYLPGVAQEHNGIIRHGAKILYAIAEATVPKISLIMRKSYGGAMIAMSSKSLGFDRVLAFPFAEVAVMGAEGAANIIFRDEIEAADNSEVKREEKIAEFTDKFMNPYVAAGYGFIDDVIDPLYTRIELIRALEMNIRKKEQNPAKKHGNIPL